MERTFDAHVLFLSFLVLPCCCYYCCLLSHPSYAAQSLAAASQRQSTPFEILLYVGFAPALPPSNPSPHPTPPPPQPNP